MAEFTLNDVVAIVVESEQRSGPNHQAKILESGLKVLYKSWKHLLEHKWSKQAAFRDRLVDLISQIGEKYPSNDLFKAQVIKLQSLAARFYYRDNDDFTLLEDQMKTVAELILENCVMTQKEQVRIVSAQCLSTMFPIMAEQNPRKNLFFKSATLF